MENIEFFKNYLNKYCEKHEKTYSEAVNDKVVKEIALEYGVIPVNYFDIEEVNKQAESYYEAARNSDDTYMIEKYLTDADFLSKYIDYVLKKERE